MADNRENEFYEQNEQYTQNQDAVPETQPEYTQSAQTTGYGDGYSAMPSEQNAEQTAAEHVEVTAESVYGVPQGEPYTNPYNYSQNQSPYAQQPSGYSDRYSQPQGYASYVQSQTVNAIPESSQGGKKPKKSKKALKRTAIIFASIVLVACVGVGGGFLGSMLANNHNAVATSGESGESSNGSNDESSKSSLTINKTEGTEVAATTTQEVAEKASDSVVEITTETVVNGQFMQQYVSQGAGSGVIISEDGYIITNNHVIDGAGNVTVRLRNGDSYDAKLIGRDSQLDVALIKIEADGLKPVTFGDSDNLKVGETAIAIGNPLGELGGTVTNGIISALDREISLDGKTMNLLQTNAAINPGNSGGGLFNANAELVGLVVAKSSGEDIEGLGFAIPINDVVDVLDDLMEHGYVTGRASLGVSLQDISSDELFSYRLDRAGTYITQIESGSAAEEAGLQVGDCITKIDDQDISTASEAASVVTSHKAGDKITVTVYRDGETKSIEVTLGEEKPDENSTSSTASNGLYDGYDFYGNY